MVRGFLILVWAVLLGAQGVPGLMAHAHAGMAVPAEAPAKAPVPAMADGDLSPCHTAADLPAPMPAPDSTPTSCDSAPTGGCHCDCAHLPVGLPGLSAWLSPRLPAVEFRPRLETDHPSATVARDLRPPILLQR